MQSYNSKLYVISKRETEHLLRAELMLVRLPHSTSKLSTFTVLVIRSILLLPHSRHTPYFYICSIYHTYIKPTKFDTFCPSAPVSTPFCTRDQK